MSTGHAQTILVVDDDEDIRNIITTFLEDAGYCTTVASTGAQGACEFSTGDVDMVITDLNMPAGDGIALVQRIRGSSDVPILVLTAFQKEYAQELRLLEHVSVVQKPFEPQTILDLVEVETSLVRKSS